MALRTLYQTLLDSDMARLRVIAQQWQVTLTADRRPDMAAELADAMAREEAMEQVLATLSDAARQALEDLLREGGALPWNIFTRKWGKLRVVGPGRLEREELWRDPISPVEVLWYWGLIQRAFAEHGATRVDMVFVPEELRLYMPSPPPAQIASPEPADAPPYTVAMADALADDLVTLWATLQVAALNVTTSSWQEMLGVQGDASVASRFDFLETLALEQGWIRRETGEGLRLVPDPVLAWLQADLWAQWSALIQAWTESQHWNDLSHVAALHPDPVRGWPNDPLQTRQVVLEMLRRCTPGSWYEIVQFVHYIKEHATDFLRPDGDYDTWALRDAQTDLPLRGFEAWDAVEGRLITFLIVGPLSWLGFVNLGAEEISRPWIKFQLSDAGAAFLELGPPPVLPEPLPLHLLDDGTVQVPARRRYERFQLNRVACALAHGEAYLYRLTPSSLALAQKQRITVSRILSFLEQTTGRPVPAHLVTAIEHAYQQGAQASLDHVWLLRVADPELFEVPSLRRLLQEQLAPGIALVHVSDRERVLAVLSKRGILLEFNEMNF